MNISIWLFRCFFTSKAFSFAPQACENWLFILPLPRLILPFDMSTPKPVAVLAVPPECFQWIGICVAGKWQLIRTKVFCANVFVLLNLTADKVWNCWARRQSRGTPPSVSPALIIQESVWCSGPSPALWEVIFNPFFWNGAKIFHLVPQAMGEGAEKSLISALWEMDALLWRLRHSFRIKQSLFFPGKKKTPQQQKFSISFLCKAKHILTPAHFTRGNCWCFSYPWIWAVWWPFGDPHLYPAPSPAPWHQHSLSTCHGTSETSQVICKDKAKVCF